MNTTTATPWLCGLALALLGCDEPEPTPRPSEAQASPAVSAAAKELAAQPDAPVAKQVGAHDALCGQICATTAALGCTTEVSCLAGCGEMRDAPVCQAEMAGFMRCAAERPKADWECGDDAMPALREGMCDPEQAALAGCLQRHAEP
jgi:hypothetical protein